MNAVTQVLLSDGKWYRVDSGSFRVGPIEFRDADDKVIPKVSGPIHFCFAFEREGGDSMVDMIHGPIDSVKAYRYDTPDF